MKMNSLLVTIFTIATSQALMAFPGLQSVKNKMQLPAAKMTSAECTNFAGTWKGECADGVKVEENTVYIDQDGCSRLYFNDTPYAIGGTDTQSSAGSSNLDSTTISFDWAEDKTVMNARIQMLSRYFNHEVQVRGNGNAQFRLEDEGKVLVQLSEYDFVVDQAGKTTTQHFSSKCSFQRQSR